MAQPPNPPATSVSPDDQYVPGADSLPQAGVPRGRIFEFVFDRSQVFPGTVRTIKVYVPAQYRAERPACVYVALDDFLPTLSAVFDNLIARQEMPITIAISVPPGVVPSIRPPANPRFDRSVEFDGLSDDLARFVVNEIFPEVETHRTPDGLPIRLSQDPNDRAAGGLSTGGIAAFTLAWQRPDAFRRVFTGIGTFVGMRGGDQYPVLVRKTEPKPLRIFMQDGSNDELTGALGEVGDWWMGNQTMDRALEFAGYAVQHVWGEGSHNPRHAIAVFPEAMRWLWKDWPQPITPGTSQNNVLKAILQPGEEWQRVAKGDPAIDAHLLNASSHRTVGPQGRVYGTDAKSGQVWMTSAGGHRRVLDSGLKGPTGIAISPDGLWLAVAESRSHWGYSYRLQSDGSVQARQRFYWFHVPDGADDSGAGGWVSDRAGRLFAATRLGVQVFDRNGRVRAILPVPGGPITDLAFAGDDLATLYALGADGNIYRRKLKVNGVAPGAAPIEMPAGNPG